MVTLTDDGAHGSSPLPASIAIDELFARLEIGPRSARTILRALLQTAYSDIRAPVPDFHGDALEVLGFGAGDPNYAPVSDDEEIVVIDPTTSLDASAATLRPASPADSVASSATSATANCAAPVASATGTASAGTPDAANTTAPVAAITATLPPTGSLTTSTAFLYSPNYVLPSNAPKNAILPPPSLVTPIYGYHVPGPNESGPYYMASRGRNIGIFSGWEILSPFVTGVSHSAYSKVSSIQEGHTRVAAAINAGFATYLT
ncbi:hypothetical protein K443DRAFT_13626 [Laccaria amethystina LaAM-08-1]|uniref:Uncharacterized protein n=1 Tax=Laccaria amethystina LaAM-08-1 TaxID=1095629 RepID=A0A0C9X7R6_9AGAR|nr:hypothetical protein K443DRAFT_13626 [Laccaria amethystina LaAM-08-1]